MKSGIFEVTPENAHDIIKSDAHSSLIFTVNAEKIHDDKSFIMEIGLAVGIESEELEKIENINWFNDVLCDYIYYKYEGLYHSFILHLENWSKLILDDTFEIGGHLYYSRKTNDYLDFLNIVVNQFSEFDPKYPDDNLMDFKVLLEIYQ